MLATTLLQKQEHHIGQLLSALEHERFVSGALLTQVRDELAVHVRAAEAVAAYVKARTLREKRSSIQGVAPELAVALTELPTAQTPGFETRIRELRHLFEGQVRYELEELVPRLESIYPRRELLAIGRMLNAEIANPYRPLCCSKTRDRELNDVTVLLADDDEDQLVLSEGILRAAGAGVVAVATLDAALEQLTVYAPDVIVSELWVSGEASQDLAPTLDRISRLARTPAMAYTRDARQSQRALALATGFRAYAAKPLGRRELVSLVAELSATPMSMAG